MHRLFCAPTIKRWTAVALAVCASSLVAPCTAMADEADAPFVVNFKLPIIPRLQGHVSTTNETSPTVPQTLDNFKNILSILDSVDTRVTDVTPRPTGKLVFVSNAAKSLANFVFDLRGFDWSKEGADAALGLAKPKQGDCAKQYLHRRAIDSLHFQVMASIMQIADGLGTSDTTSGEQEVSEAVKMLEQAVGKKDAALILEDLVNAQSAAHAATNPTTAWNLRQQNEKLASVLQAAADKDPIVNKLTKELEKFNHRSKAIQVTAKVVYCGLGLASFTPTLVAPIAETTLLAFMMASGGPEQDKLLKELYLSKCLESRVKLINDESHLLLAAYQMSATSQNALLSNCCKVLAARFGAADVLFGTPNQSSQVASKATAANKNN